MQWIEYEEARLRLLALTVEADKLAEHAGNLASQTRYPNHEMAIEFMGLFSYILSVGGTADHCLALDTAEAFKLLNAVSLFGISALDSYASA